MLHVENGIIDMVQALKPMVLFIQYAIVGHHRLSPDIQLQNPAQPAVPSRGSDCVPTQGWGWHSKWSLRCQSHPPQAHGMP